jgi:predicted RNA polymerase sigma factor
VHERFLRAEALEQLGDEGAALGWYEALTQTSALEIAYLAPTYLRSARILERLGATDSAAVHYRRFIDLWRDCDAEQRPALLDAEQRLRALHAPGS